MARCFAHVTGIVIALVLLMATVVGPVYASEARSGYRESSAIFTDEAKPPEETALACLMLVGGTAVFAGIVWMREVRRMLA